MEDNIFNTNLPKHWEVTNLGEICQRGGGSIQTGPFGSQLHASDYVPVGIPFVMPTNIGENRIIEEGIVRVREEDAERLSRHRLRVGDIVYSRRGDVTKRALIREREDGWMCGSGCMKIRFGEGIVDPTFASMYLGHPVIKDWIVRHAIGATMPNLNTSVMSAVPFLLPPLEGQKAIATILSSLDDKIELNRRMNATLEAMARALFKAWFVDFEPVHANLENRPSTSASPEIAKLFPSTLENGIPKGWTIGKIGNLCSVNKNTLNKSDRFEFLKYVEISEVSKGVINNVAIYKRGAEPSRAKRKLSHGDVVISTVRPDRGSYFLAFNPEPNLIASTGFAVFTPHLVPFSLLYLFLTDEEQLTFYGKRADGAAYPAINQSAISEMDSIVPTKEVLNEFHSLTELMLSRIANNLEESKSLADLRDSLLPRLISGRIKIGVHKYAAKD